MFSRTLHKFRHSLALRLTVWYAGIFTVSSVLALTLVYELVVSSLQQRTDKDMEENITEFASFMRDGGLERVKSEMALETEGDQAEDVYFRLWTAGGRELATTDLASWPGLATPTHILRMLTNGEEPVLETLMLPRRPYSTRIVYGTIGPGVALEIGQSLEEDEEFIAALLNGFLIALATVIALGSPIGWFLARRALRGVEEITRTATEISNGALDQRVEVRSQGDELDRLAQTFNAMLDRIQALIGGMRDMTDNLAHDLRSPLARIRASAEVALAHGETKGARESLAVNTIEECDRLLDMINTTLDIAEAESGAAKMKVSDLDLVGVVLAACELFQTVAEDNGVTLVTDLPAQCRIRADLQRLQRVIANLLDNALKYTKAGGQVRIALVDEGERVKLSVEDTGVGISADELPRIFERFYRCDRSRSKAGIGLGLSLARAFVRAHGGDIVATSAPGTGSTFTVVLPRPLPGQSRQQLPHAQSHLKPDEING